MFLAYDMSKKQIVLFYYTNFDCLFLMTANFPWSSSWPSVQHCSAHKPRSSRQENTISRDSTTEFLQWTRQTTFHVCHARSEKMRKVQLPTNWTQSVKPKQKLHVLEQIDNDNKQQIICWCQLQFIRDHRFKPWLWGCWWCWLELLVDCHCM